MKKIIVKAPVNTLKGAHMQINAGAGELYCGFEYSEYGKSINFSGRKKNSCFDKRKTVLSYEDFVKTNELAHQNNVKVELVANVPGVNDCNFTGKNNLRKHYLDYVYRGIEAGADRVIVGDLGNILSIRNAGIDIPITISTFLMTLNKATLSFYKELGIDKVVLPHPLSLDEIKEIVQSTDVKIEIFGHFGCSFLEGSCSLLHVNNSNFQTGIPCRAKYKIRETSEEINILDMNEDCSLCQLDRIMDTGIDSIKTIGRDLDPAFMSQITAVYTRAIDLFLEGLDKTRVLEIIKDEMDFSLWEDIFCNHNRCKYQSFAYQI
jgi:putative protease